MRVVFMGTPDFSVKPLEGLIERGDDVVCVVTREDKPRGRGHQMQPSDVKAKALEHGLHVITPKSMKDRAVIEELKEYQADVFVVVAYGKILPKEVLEIPKYGCINIHASLLPAYRGAAPIQWAILDGCTTTGITTMQMDEGLDTGDILKQYEIPITLDETGGSLFEKLAVLGKEAIIDTLNDLERGLLHPKKQEKSPTGYAVMLNKTMGNIDFTKSPQEIEYLVRGLNPWPSAYSYLGNKTLKIWKAKPYSTEDISYTPSDFGKILLRNQQMFVICGGGLLEILELQLEGKKRMDTAAFLRGVTLNEDYLRSEKC